MPFVLVDDGADFELDEHVWVHEWSDAENGGGANITKEFAVSFSCLFPLSGNVVHEHARANHVL